MPALLSSIQMFFMEWPDIFWLPLAAFIVHKGQKLKAMFFIVVCMASLRLQMEIMQSIGFNYGFTGWFSLSSFYRGVIVYGLFIALYLLLSYLSPYTKGPIYLAASLSIFFMAFFVSSVFMII